MSESNKRVAIVSGGMDSITMLHDMVTKHPELEFHALSLDYGSKHNDKELPFAKYHCDLLGVPHRVVRLDFIAEAFKSDLLKTGGDVPEGHYAADNMKATVVPFRNGIMLAIAVGYAESIEATSVYIGAHAGDHTIYPDCRADFRDAMSQAAQLGTYAGVTIEAPYVMIGKHDIAAIGSALGVDYTKTWSCYKGQDLHCARCGTCVERIEAFALAGVADPTEYEDTEYAKQVLANYATAK
jgi:7-cyano-7-deazaguanine synthase